VGALYDGCDAVGLPYGTGYRTLEQAWGGGGAAAARLRARAASQGTRVHPADLDDALCTSALVPGSAGGGTRLPFAVDDALLQGGGGELWAAAVRQGADAVGVLLGVSARWASARLDGFKTRRTRNKSHVASPYRGHPLLRNSLVLALSPETLTFQLPLQGSLFALTCDHVVNGQFMLPSATYLELFNAVAMSPACDKRVRTLSHSIFQRPLMHEPGINIECELDGVDSFEVRSGFLHNGGFTCGATHFTSQAGSQATVAQTTDQGSNPADFDDELWNRYAATFGAAMLFAMSSTPFVGADGQLCTPPLRGRLYPSDILALIALIGFCGFEGTTTVRLPFAAEQVDFALVGRRDGLELVTAVSNTTE
jgi:hypothetical protein